MAASSNGRVVPAAYPPPVDSQKEFIKRELDAEDEQIEVGVAIVGGGTAGLATANRLLQLLADDPETMERLGEVPVAVIEKAKTCGGHNLSGAIMRPQALQDLFPDLSREQWREEGFAFGEVTKDAIYALPNGKRKATVLAEGCWGHLTGAAIKEFDLADGREPQVWELGVKEVWKVPKPLDRVIHTLGPWPVKLSPKYGQIGGTWLYPMTDKNGDHFVSIGFVVDLEYADATTSVHDLLQLFKTHPLVRGILEGGERVAWGAKALPGGGYWSMPKLTMPGALLVGDAGGMVDTVALKGVHHSVKSGHLAAEAIYASLKAGSSDYSSYEQAIEGSQVGKELYEVRNTRQPFQLGFLQGGPLVNIMIATKGRFPAGRWSWHRNDAQPMFVGKTKDAYPKPDGKYTFDKLSSVFITGNATRDDAPNHIRVRKHVPREIAETWRWMCPAGVYEIPEDAPEHGDVDVIVNYTNCVQCGASTAKGGGLTTPEGGDGPLYQLT